MTTLLGFDIFYQKELIFVFLLKRKIMRIHGHSLTKLFSGHPDESSWLFDSHWLLNVPAQVVRLGHLSIIIAHS